ncbi:MAG: sodium-translocating pyrophosphatase [Actinobacteria bacterium HGW-Actinobacteria-5]|nr:MAG: sodium-translocating pyrophosphatase [Actinobacteria bacterium HGW-Actinobacteria-5]
MRALLLAVFGLLALTLTACSGGGGAAAEGGGGEANLKLPELLRDPNFTIGGMNGLVPLYIGLVITILGLLFGVWTYSRLKALPVHRSMKEISEIIYTTCKAYLVKQGKFLLLLWAFIAVVIIVYFAVSGIPAWQIAVIILFSLIGMAGSFGVAWFGIRINTFANSRTSHAALKGEKWAVHDIPARSGMSVGMVLISLELFLMLIILVFLPVDLAGKSFIGFAIGESLGASALRIAGGIFTKIADVGSDLMKIVFKIDEDDPRNPGTIADCTGDNAGDSVGPSADGFETYGVTGVALITFILLGVAQVQGANPALQAVLLVWIFAIRAIMLVASAASYFASEAMARNSYGKEDFDFEKPLTSLVWVTSIVSIVLTFAFSAFLLSGNGVSPNLWWQLSIIVSCGTLAGALIPELVKVFTSTNSAHVKEVVKSSEQGGASLNILSGFVAGNFAAYWLGIVIVGLMGIAFLVAQASDLDTALGTLPHASAVFAFGLVAFGFLGMGPVTIAVDSYGPVTDNAQSVYELSRIEAIPGIDEELRTDFGFTPVWDKAKAMLEENDGAGNTFKATAKPVLIGTAVVGATTMIFSIILFLAQNLAGGKELTDLNQVAALLSPIHAPFLLGLITGGAMIFWFTGAATQAVTTGAYRAVEYIKAHIHLDPSADAKASTKDSTEVVEICTDYAQRGMLVIFLAIFFGTLAFAFVEPYFFIGYLIAIAVVGLYQAIFMANAGGAWDNAKKIVETDMGMKGTELHDATVVGDTVGDPFKDTSSVALNPVIKFTTLFGLLAVELAVSLTNQGGGTIVQVMAAVFFLVSAYFVWRSFYRMRITDASTGGSQPTDGVTAPAAEAKAEA